MRGAAYMIACIFAMDRLNSNIWNDIIDLICDNINHENFEIKKAAAFSLNYICEILDENKEI